MNNFNLREMSLRFSIDLILIILIATTAMGFMPASSLKLANFPGKSQVISGDTFPRNHRTLYRGLDTKQMNHIKAIAAMLGDDRNNTESGLFYCVRYALMNPMDSCPLLGEKSQVRLEYLQYGIASYIQQELSSFGFDPADETKQRGMDFERAFEAANRIFDQIFYSGMTQSQFENSFLDYSNPLRTDWPQAHIYSTVYIEVARAYQPTILVFKEQNPKSVDMNYWNYVHNGFWLNIFHKWRDRGEFLTPYYINANDILGYQWRNSTDGGAAGVTFIGLPADLNLAFYRFDYLGNRYVVIIDGDQNGDGSKRAQHIEVVDKDGGGRKFYYAQGTWPAVEAYTTFPGYPKIQNEAYVKGIIALCNPKVVCTLPDGLWEQFHARKNQDVSGLARSIHNIRIGNKYARIFNNEEPIEPPPPKPTPKPVEMPKDAKTPEEVIALLYKHDQESLKPLKYTVENRNYQGDVTNRKLNKQIVVDFANFELKPKHVIYVTVPYEFRNYPINKIYLTHRQDKSKQSKEEIEKRRDPKPAYTSIQYHTIDPNESDQWRYFGGRTYGGSPKGSMFAEIVDEEDMRTFDQEIEDDGHKGFLTDVHSDEDLYVNAIRLMNVGDDVAIIKSLSVRFSHDKPKAEDE